jgi:hypothetical protein
MTPRFTRTLPFTLGALSLAALTSTLLVACGGGGGGSSGGTNANSATYSGTVTGLGSIVVNGVRFSTAGATTADGDNPESPFTKAFGLGTTVSVTGTVDTATGTGTATSIAVHGGARGLVSAVGSNTFTVAGQVVTVDSNTVYEGSSSTFGLASLVAGTSYVEVYGVLDSATGNLLATRVEQKTSTEVTAAGFAVKGQVKAVSGSTFDIALRSGVTAHVTFDSSTVLPTGSTVAVGSDVRVILNGTDASSLANATGTATVNVTATKVVVRKLKQSDGGQAKVQGAITVVSAGSQWTIGDVTIDISQSPTVSDNLNLGTIATGTVVKVAGSFANGVLVAKAIEADSHERTQTGGGVKLYGAVTAVNSTDSTFTVQGVTVKLDSTATPSQSLPAVDTYVEVVARANASGVLIVRSLSTTQAGTAPRMFEVYGNAPCASGSSDLAANTFNLTVRDGNVSVDGSAATITTGRGVSFAITNGTGTCLVEVTGSMITPSGSSTKVLKATRIEVKQRTVSNAS